MARHARGHRQHYPRFHAFDCNHHGQVIGGDIGAAGALADNERETAVVIRDGACAGGVRREMKWTKRKVAAYLANVQLAIGKKKRKCSLPQRKF